jgi:hypothetical protein
MEHTTRFVFSNCLDTFFDFSVLPKDIGRKSRRAAMPSSSTGFGFDLAGGGCCFLEDLPNDWGRKSERLLPFQVETKRIINKKQKRNQEFDEPRIGKK